MIRHTFLLMSAFLILATYAAETERCRPCIAYGRSRRPDSSFTHRDGCREYNCRCECSGSWQCPAEQITDVCKSDSDCSSCWAGKQLREPNRPFQFTEDCYQYNCFCACDGSWNCPKEDTRDICNTDPDTGCYFCELDGKRYKGNTHFKHVNGCIEYDCACNCDGSYNCPGENAVDKCKTNPKTGCYYCEAFNKKFEGNAYFKHRNGCIEYNCVCNCDGSWDCPGEKARDLCRQNHTTGCYYCEVDGYLHHGSSRFDLVRDCYKYPGCKCDCDGSWTCAHTRGEYICDRSGREVSECTVCAIDGKTYRGNSMFSLDRGCSRYICTCDCSGNFLCPSENEINVCDNSQYTNINSGVSDEVGHTRDPRQACTPCTVEKRTYRDGDQFSYDVNCNRFQCFCKCDGTFDCPSELTVNICTGSGSYRRTGSSGSVSGSGLDASAAGIRQGSSVTAISRGTLVTSDGDQDRGVNVCRECKYLGVTYEGNNPFTFEKGCWQYNCFCACNGSFNCPSDRSSYICEGRKECVRCDLTDYDGSFKEPNTNFQIKRGCELFENCRCNCDGGWSCEDGVYTCELKSGCEVDGRKYAPNKNFDLIRGCDKYKDCYCFDDGRWSCEGQIVEDLCGQCRKCKIGDVYYDGDTTFSANVNCTRYSRCECKCDGSYECRGGRYTCDSRGDQPPEGQCTDCIIDGRRYRQGQSFDYTSRGCLKHRACECRCGETTCQEVDDTCGDCRSCNVNGVDYAGGSQFSYKQGCYEYSRCECNCNGRWECFGDSAKDSCCRKCNVDGVVYDSYTKFKLDRKCWNYQCFCLCNGTAWCPSATVVNTCNEPERCQRCDVDGLDIRGNTHFTYTYNDMEMHCRCNCDGSYVCVAEWMYIKADLSISGAGIGSGLDGCLNCVMDGLTYRGDTRFALTHSGISFNCECYCNGGYYCYGETTFKYKGCRTCSLYGHTFAGDTSFNFIYKGLKVACQCTCDGSYECYGSKSELVISCSGSGCLPTTCTQCVVDGVRFDGLDQFGTVYRGKNLRCECGCDGSYYCEGSGGIIISCVPGRGCVELGCSSCDIFGNKYDGGSAFEFYYQGLKLGCQCECGGNYRCFGSSGEIIVSCIDGVGCLTGSCRACVVNNRRYDGRTTFRFDYNGIDMLCNCACDGSYYCEGVTELIQISCIGGQCTRLGCAPCNLFGVSYEGDTAFDLVYAGLKLKCQCSCDSGYVCYGSSSTAVVTCLGGRGSGCLPSTCSPCTVNNREYAGRSTFRTSYKGIDVMCTCGCDGSSYCVGITTSIEVSCIGNRCTRIGCKECSIFGKEYIGGSQFDIIYQGLPVTCECDCDGGYVCKGSTGITVVTCVNGFGPGCLISRCSQCEIEGRRFEGATKFRTIYQGIDFECTCACDSSYYCEGVREEIQISCYDGKCTPIGCKTCNIFGNSYNGASTFNLVYTGLLLDCQCLCDGGYTCVGEQDTVIIQCRNGRGNCLDQICRTCEMNGRTLAAGSTGRLQYEGIDVTCTCGCDGSVYCVGVFEKITISCIGGRCTPVGCRSCNIFGEEHAALSSFKVIYSGYRLNCQCDCLGGYYCEGDINVECRGTSLSGCLSDTCRTCSLDGNQYRGKQVFKYVYNGIDVSCTCGCDGSVFCVGVTEVIQLRCIGGSCSPYGCRTCRIFDKEYPAFSDIDVIYRGVKIDCKCSCDSSYFCIGSSGSRVVDCEAGRNCLTDPCRQCIVGGRRYAAYSTFPHKYKNIDMQCRCGCDGTAFCEGTEEVIYVSCIGETCSIVGCDTCSIFGETYQGDSNFNMVYKGVKMDCTCNCDTSYRCIGTSTNDTLVCPVGQSCVSERCKKCRVNGDRYDGGQTFTFDYQGIEMKCLCGCDGSYFCQGVTIEIEISCQRRGGCTQIGGCRSCNIFGREYAGRSRTEFVYQGYFMTCQCNCDSSYKCIGTRNEVIVECLAGQQCLDRGCGTCNIDGREFGGNTQFDYRINDKDMRCTCGCDGSYYCRCKDDNSEISCNRRGSCTWIGCDTCLSDGRQRQAYEEFEKIYDGTRMNCLCSCDGSYRCQGVDRRIVILCRNDACSLQGCRSCLVEGREYQNNDEFETYQGSIRKRCRCNCDGSTDCTTIVRPACVSCTIDGEFYEGHSRKRVYKGSTPYICDCYCDGTHKCYPETQPSCKECSIDGIIYSGNTQFEALLEGVRMQCTCDCGGRFSCRSETRTCTNDGCVDNCRRCSIDGQTFDSNTNFRANVFGLLMDCSCDCQGSYSCRSETRTCTSLSGCVDNCRRCVIDGQTFQGNTNFQANVFGLVMDCSCDCQGSYSCRSETRTCSSLSGCVDNCRQCNIDGKTFQGNTNFQANVFGLRMDCSCDCQGSYSCSSETRTCSSLSGCVDNCRRCNIDGQTFQGNTNFQANVFGLLMDCSCDCQGSYSCRSETRTCSSLSGCVDNCRRCNIDGQTFQGNTNFQANVFGLRMDCSCDCQGSYSCRSETRTCSSLSGCVDNCRRCNIDGQTFQGNTDFQANVFGLLMDCSCDCQGSYSCRSETRTCSSLSGCVDNCRRCNIDGQTFQGNTNFQANVFGLRMDCSCDCQGSYSCRSETRTCSSLSGCVDNCRRCNIDGQTFQGNTNFQANVFGLRMDCSCDCQGTYSCRSETRTCSSLSGCVDNCRRCNIDGKTFQGNTNFQANVFGLVMDCSCDCQGSYSCRSETRTCTSISGCVDNCRPCLIDGQRFEGNRNFDASVFGDLMQCTCDCTGSYSCRSSRQTCTSVSGCVSTCKQCYVNGRGHAGNSEFEANLQGVRMRCNCDCNGDYVCTGGTYRCTRFGCENTCQGCEIEGKLYTGNSRFEIFHNAYGIKMTCECECGGSYTCKGTKEVPSCIGSGCQGDGCNQCTINGRKYDGNTQFETIIDGIRMQCSCYCSGGYRCTGTRTEKTCYGPGCESGGCNNCVIRGTTYRGNTEFEIVGDDGIRMKCYCDCEGRFTCKGEKSTTICVGAGCDGSEVSECIPCVYEGSEYRGGSSFNTIRDGLQMDCTCSCGGIVRCEGTRVVKCEGPDCFTGCRRCIIDGVPYTGNTRLSFRKGNLEYSCTCYCDGSHNCKGSTGFETSCVGESCAADHCRSCRLFNKEYQLDARFRLQKNDLIMNCVCECDGAYRCFSVTGTCIGNDCDQYGCKSCTAENKVFSANTEFELSTGMICTCQCNGEYSCRAKSLQVECVGSGCGVGDECKKCYVDGDFHPGNTRFQIRKYGLLMQCACNCDSSYTCRGYEIIADGESPVDFDCSSCEINGKRYNGNTRFQVMINGERNVCSCDCDGTHSCSHSDTGCQDCVIDRQTYASGRDFTLYKNGESILCRCGCSGNFVCEGRRDGSETPGNCRECRIFGQRYAGDTKFTTDIGGITSLCECFCTGEYTCKGYRQITNVILPAKEEKSCESCYVAGTEHPGNTKFLIQRGCFQVECVCGCEGRWECPDQTPRYICPGGFDFDSKTVQQQRYSIAGSHVYTTGPDSSDSKQSVIYTGEESVSTVFGAGGECRSCFINEREYSGNTDFILQDGCLRWTCACDCSGGWNCSSVTGSECEGPLGPFERKRCQNCEAFDNQYPPNQRFVAEDKCYRYSCMCNCDGSWECPRQLTVQICNDTSIYDPEKGTCRQCVIGQNNYNYGETFDLVDNCISYKCLCQCDGKYNCPANTGVRVCRRGSGSGGRIVTTGSNTVDKTGRTVVAIRPAGYGNTDSSSFSSSFGTQVDGKMYRIQANHGNQGQSSSSSSGFGSFGSSSSSGSYYSGSGCKDCVVDGKPLRGGRDFTFQSGCIEHLCECFCNGTHYCDPDKQINFCEVDRARASNVEPKGCAVGNRTYKTKLFSYEADCKKYYCRCYDDGTYVCDANKTRKIC